MAIEHRQWTPGGRWVLPVASALTTCALLAGLLVARHAIAVDAAGVQAAKSAAIAALESSRRSQAPACAAEVAFARTLPEDVSMDALVRSLQESARAFGVTLVSVSGEPHAAAPRALATLAVNIALRGSYAAVKATLAEGLSRFPSVVLQRLHMKREGPSMPVVEEVSAQLVFALRPPVEGPISCKLDVQAQAGQSVAERIGYPGSAAP